ncbi:MAG TPA: DUF732 domain-containing protein, partial [Acidimicrobiales bacterium]|nr:DUF732 domain-containing protein [Acidimicrobiales bacterium]
WLPGQAGTPNGQRRLYVDLVVFDGPHGQPALAPGSLAAALADVIDGVTVPGQPASPPAAYLDEVHRSASPYAKQSDRALLALGQGTCASLGGSSTAAEGEKLIDAVLRKGTDPLGQAVPVAFAVQQLCPQYLPGLRQQLQSMLYR